MGEVAYRTGLHSMASLQSKMEADLEEMVTCAICTSRMKDPKHLQCQHAFCAHCLQEWMDSPSNANSAQVPCPSCRHPTDLPGKGVDGLPADFNKNVLLEMLNPPSMVDKEPVSLSPRYCSICWLTHGHSELALSFCSDCEEHLCGECLGNHNSEPALKDHYVILGLTEDLQATGYLCDIHNGKKLAFYCPQCLQLICSVCLRTSHLGHGAQNVEEAAAERRASIEEMLVSMDKVKLQVEAACPVRSRGQVDAMVESLREEIQQHACNARRDLDNWLDRATNDLRKRKSVLYSKIEKKTEYLMMLSSLKSHYKERLSDPDPRSLLTDFDDLISRAEPLLQPDTRSLRVPKWSFVPLVWPNRLGYLEEETADCHGSPGARNTCNPQSEQEQGKNRRWSSASVCEQYTGPGRSSLRKAASADEGSTGILNEIADMLNYKNKTGTPSTSHGVVNGQLKVRSQKTWSSIDGDVQHMTSASDVILGCEDWVLVADPSRGRVQRLWFDDQSRLPETVLQDATPRRMALSKDGSIAVTDQGYVHMLAVKSQTISARPKWTPLEMVQPFAVAFVEETQQMVLTDMHDRTVVIYDEKLRHMRSFGGPEVFGSPNCIWCDQKGRVLVSDQTKNNVQAFTLDGEFLWKIDHFKPHQPLVTPSGISVDDNGQIYVGCLDGRAGVFSSDGRFMCHLVDQFETLTSVRGLSCRRDSGQNSALVAICGATANDQSMVRLWRVPTIRVCSEV